MSKLIIGLILIYHTFLRTIGKILGLLTAGLWMGYAEGVDAVNDMYKFLAYQAKAAEIKRRKAKAGRDE